MATTHWPLAWLHAGVAILSPDDFHRRFRIFLQIIKEEKVGEMLVEEEEEEVIDCVLHGKELFL